MADARLDDADDAGHDHAAEFLERNGAGFAGGFGRAGMDAVWVVEHPRSECDWSCVRVELGIPTVIVPMGILTESA
ncbi:hypothetical protein [Rhodococcus opacus]|nr:hypothetical protein [Rhodococcus opacus]